MSHSFAVLKVIHTKIKKKIYIYIAEINNIMQGCSIQRFNFMIVVVNPFGIHYL